MGSPTYILCPGQGAQAVGMGADYAARSPAARATFERADAALEMELSKLCFDGPEAKLNGTDISQPAIYVTSVACFGAAAEAGKINPSTVTAYAGLSLGEYTALHLAGVFSFEAGLDLVRKRGRYMQEAATAVPSGMVAIMGADKPAVAALCEEAGGGEVLAPANFNAPGQIVVSGVQAACDRILKSAEAAGYKAAALKVAGAFHSPLMQPAADRMEAELAKVEFHSPTAPVYSNVTATVHRDADSIKRLLVEQIVSPVLWEDTMIRLIGAAGDGEGPGRFVELAPGRTLAGLAKRINRRLPIENLGSADSLNAGV